jgi:hypothetical protein
MNYDNTNTGVLFGNLDSSEPHENRNPNFTGGVNIDGKEYNLAGWVRYGKDGGKMAGRKFLSLKIEPKQMPKRATINYDYKDAENREMEAQRQQTKRPSATEDFDDSIPF